VAALLKWKAENKVGRKARLAELEVGEADREKLLAALDDAK